MKSVMVSIPAANTRPKEGDQTPFRGRKRPTAASTLTALPTKLCFSVSHSGAARTPLATRAKKAFLTFGVKREDKGNETVSMEEAAAQVDSLTAR